MIDPHVWFHQGRIELWNGGNIGPRRCFRVTTPIESMEDVYGLRSRYRVSVITPPAGGTIDGVTWEGIGGGVGGILALPGRPVYVEAAAAFNAGTDLRTDASGRVSAAGPGDAIVLRSIEASSGSGDYIGAVFTGGR